MKWTWDKFGFEKPDRDPSGDIQAIFAALIPEVADGRLKIVAVCRDVDVLKVAVAGSNLDSIDARTLHQLCVELGVKTVRVVPWSDNPESLIPNTLQPAEVEQVLLCDMIGRATVVVREDQLSLAIGRRGQNVRLASKLCGWDIVVMTRTELEEQIEQAVVRYANLEGMTEELAQQLVEQGCLSYDDLSIIDPDALMEMGSLTEEQADKIIDQAERNTGEDDDQDD